MTHLLQDGDLTIDPLDVRMVLNLVLLEDLNGYFVAGHYVRTLLHFTEGTLSFCLADDEAADDFAFTVLFFLRVLGRLCASRISSLVCAVLFTFIFDRGRRFLISCRFRSLVLIFIVSLQ